MNTYVVTLKKTATVEVSAESEFDAIKKAEDCESGVWWDDADVECLDDDN